MACVTLAAGTVSSTRRAMSWVTAGKRESGRLAGAGRGAGAGGGGDLPGEALGVEEVEPLVRRLAPATGAHAADDADDDLALLREILGTAEVDAGGFEEGDGAALAA